MDIRAFFSIQLPLTTKQLIADQLIAPLKKLLSKKEINWAKKENLHITLQFIEQIDAFDVESLIQNVKIELNNTTPFYINFGDVELFPDSAKPRVISLSVKPNEMLTQLSKQVGDAILRTSYPIETRPFRAHLTLAKSHDLKFKNHIFDHLPKPDLGQIQITEIILFRSEPDKEGSNYTELASFLLPCKEI